MKNRFYGKYYKFISDSGFVFACIDSFANEGKMLQIITDEGSFLISDTGSFNADGGVFDFDVHTGGLTVTGRLTAGEFHPLKTKVMGPFSHLPLECRHEIYSMYHTLDGTLEVNGKTVTFTGSPGYIEGDSGKNFPSRYIWYNSVGESASVTVAIATIPLFGFIRFTGVLCFIRTPDREYSICTYNRAKADLISKDRIVVKNGDAVFTLNIEGEGGHELKAPVKGNMDRYIKESVTLKTSYSLTANGRTLLENEDPISSLEYMWD
ncbi:MAG: hypothetical protein J5793_05600 [Clostridia bacterium]|nr:hypothetical protein [Clostridia bacterium]